MILTDRTHRPFKLACAPLPFLATDLGTNLYVHVDEPNKNRDGNDVPLELKKQLAELGWVEEGRCGGSTTNVDQDAIVAAAFSKSTGSFGWWFW